MAWQNEELCSKLKALGVHRNQSGYKAYYPAGAPPKHNMKERNAIKLVCLSCTTRECVYEKENW